MTYFEIFFLLYLVEKENTFQINIIMISNTSFDGKY